MNWNEFIKKESTEEYYQKIIQQVQSDSKTNTVYPAHNNLFNAFKFTPLDKVKVVILGQDPYHGENQAHGLSFSVMPGVTPPPSLVNIFKELKSDLNIDPPTHGCLEPWARQGVMLLNTSLTVRKGEAGSHSKIGWEIFTDRAIQIINDEKSKIVFILWGTHARKKKALIDCSKHLVLESAHPSPLSAHNGFFGSKPFSETNKYLSDNNISPIDWSIT